MKESDVLKLVKIEAAKKNCLLWRNNSGAVYDRKGNFIRYGLANESAKMNEIIKSGDLIGIKCVTVTREMVGTKVGIFVSREVKRSDWKYTGTPREVAQKAFIDLVNSLGGDAAFAYGEGTF